MGFLASMFSGIGGMFKGGGGNNALLGPQPMSHGGSQQLPPSPFAPQSVAPVAPPTPRVRPVTTSDMPQPKAKPTGPQAPGKTSAVVMPQPKPADTTGGGKPPVAPPAPSVGGPFTPKSGAES